MSGISVSRHWLVYLLAVGCVWLAISGDFALAQNSLGLGRPEPAIKPEGPFASVLLWIQQEQKAFYRSMTNTLKTIRSGEGGFWLLVGLSFLYGVLHAAGPGHGKAVISSYMLANEVQLRRGILLSFASSTLQAIVAIVGIGMLVFFLRGLGIRQVEFTKWLEITSYAGITLLGIWLLWRKVFRVPPKVETGHAHSHHAHSHPHDHELSHSHDHLHVHTHGAGEVCSDCGHLHAPDPDLLNGEMGLKEAWTAVFAVGLRPCTGAMIVLTFSFLNGLYWAGIMSAFAMAIGTGITVSAIATIAVTAKNLALSYSGATEASAGFYRVVEISGALFVLLIGVTLLSASLV